MDYDEIRVGAHHRQTLGERGAKDRRIGLDRVLPLGRAGIQNKIGLGRRVDKREIEAFAHFEVAVGADLQTSAPQRGVERLVAVLQGLPRFFSGRHDTVIKPLGHTDPRDAADNIIRSPRRVRQQDEALTGAEQPLHAVEHAGNRRGAVMHDAP